MKILKVLILIRSFFLGRSVRNRIAHKIFMDYPALVVIGSSDSIRRMNPPRVVIDNESCKNATVIKVDSANKQGIPLEVFQVLTDLNHAVNKAYICSDGGWLMDVFNVTDHDGNKITNESILDYIQKHSILSSTNAGVSLADDSGDRLLVSSDCTVVKPGWKPLDDC